MKADQATSADWPLYEVFLRGKRGLNHVHVGSLHAADDEMALRHARDVYTRRNEGVSIWVVQSNSIVATVDTGPGSEGLTATADGNVLVAVAGGNEIVMVQPARNAAFHTLETGEEPRRMVFHEGPLWITNTGDGTLSAFSEYPVPE
jgi:phenylacetate-CoA oxygenase PaaH subunit